MLYECVSKPPGVNCLAGLIWWNGKSIRTLYCTLGQALPTHRLAYSPQGGLFQPVITQCIRLLSRGPFTQPTPLHPDWPHSTIRSNAQYYDMDALFDNPTSTYTTTTSDRFQAPSAYSARRHAWVHVFPEGKIHQHPDRLVRYFKWGVARLILESEPCPKVVPMWIEGLDNVMHESRGWPRFIPRIFGKPIFVAFGEPVSENVWDRFRERWKQMKAKELENPSDPAFRNSLQGSSDNATEFLNNQLRYGDEAKELRMEVALVMREEVLKLRRARGWSDDESNVGPSTLTAEGVEKKTDDDSKGKISNPDPQAGPALLK